MAQHDYVIANGSGSAVRSDLNNALAAIVSHNSGTSEPTTTYAYMPWADTSAGVMKLRNGANNAWITLYQLDGTYSAVALENGTAAAPSLYFKDSGTDTGVYSPGPDQVGITTGGTVRLTTSTTAFTGTLPWRGQDGTAAAPAFSFNSDTDIGLYRIGANQLGIATNGVERVNVGTTEVVWNDGGADIDFRVEGNTKANLFKIDAGTDTVSIDGTFATGNVNYPTEGSLSSRNKIINGGMAIDQRNGGASQTFTAAAALAYSVDRWYGYCTGANVTGQQVAGATAGQYRYRFTGAASVTAIGFGQRIEQLNSADLAGITATLSVDLANSLLTTVTWTAYYATTADTFGTLASPTRTQIATGTFTVNSTVTRYSTQISIPSAATTGIEIVFTVGSQTSGTWTIGNVQLEAGTVATPFERRSYGQEIQLSERYYQILLAGITIAGASSSGSYTFATPYRTVPRPVVTTSLVSYANSSLANASSLTCSAAGIYGINTQWTATANGFAGVTYTDIRINAEL